MSIEQRNPTLIGIITGLIIVFAAESGYWIGRALTHSGFLTWYVGSISLVAAIIIFLPIWAAFLWFIRRFSQ
jgi:hypothetical protein